MTPDSTGMYAVTGRLAAECGALLRAALDAGAAPRPATDAPLVCLAMRQALRLQEREQRPGLLRRAASVQ